MSVCVFAIDLRSKKDTKNNEKYVKCNISRVCVFIPTVNKKKVPKLMCKSNKNFKLKKVTHKMICKHCCYFEEQQWDFKK